MTHLGIQYLGTICGIEVKHGFPEMCSPFTLTKLTPDFSSFYVSDLCKFSTLFRKIGHISSQSVLKNVMIMNRGKNETVYFEIV